MVMRNLSENVPVMERDREFEKKVYFQKLSLTSEILKWHATQGSAFMNGSHVSSA